MNLTRCTWLGLGLATRALPRLATGPGRAQGPTTAAPAARNTTTQALHALFERCWEDKARLCLEWATVQWTKCRQTGNSPAASASSLPT